jgi:hypothetical protein
MTQAAQPQPQSPWLFGPGRDAFFGYGFAYILSVPLFVWYFVLGERYQAPAWLLIVLTFALVTPHFGATILRAYERREDRRRYAVFTVWTTLALGLVFIGSLYSALLGSLVMTLYFSWTPWHFSGQNYGVGVMYLRRRGIPIDGPVKRVFYASFVLSAVLAILSLHMATSGLVYSRGGDTLDIVRVMQLGIPFGPGAALAGIMAIGWLGCLGFVAWHLLRRASAAVLAPIGLLAVMQSLWFVVPALAATTHLFDLPRQYMISFTPVWVSAAHSTQYLWVTSYYARRANPDRGEVIYLGRALLAGAAILALGLPFIPGLLQASVPNGAAVSVLVLAMMNIHHFILDGAIWKLRDGRVARVLLRSEGEATGPDTGRLRRLGGLTVALAGSLLLLVQGYSYVLYEVASQPEVQLPVLRQATVQLDWLGLGKDTAPLWATLGSRLEAAGEPGPALAAYRRYFMNRPQPDPVVTERALRLILTGKWPALLGQADGLARYLARSLGDERPDGEEIVAALAAARGDAGAAVAAAERALEIALRRGDATAAARIRGNLSSYRQLASSSVPTGG